MLKTGGTRGNKVSKLTFQSRYGDNITTMETPLVVMLRIAMFEKTLKKEKSFLKKKLISVCLDLWLLDYNAD